VRGAPPPRRRPPGLAAGGGGGGKGAVGEGWSAIARQKGDVREEDTHAWVDEEAGVRE